MKKRNLLITTIGLSFALSACSANQVAQQTPIGQQPNLQQQVPVQQQTTTQQQYPVQQQAAPLTAPISQETASQTALDQVPGATAQNLYIALEMDDGYLHYDGTIIYNNMEYSFDIDATTGNILSWEMESVFD